MDIWTQKSGFKARLCRNRCNYCYMYVPDLLLLIHVLLSSNSHCAVLYSSRVCAIRVTNYEKPLNGKSCVKTVVAEIQLKPLYLCLKLITMDSRAEDIKVVMWMVVDLQTITHCGGF